MVTNDLPMVTNILPMVVHSSQGIQCCLIKKKLQKLMKKSEKRNKNEFATDINANFTISYQRNIGYANDAYQWLVDGNPWNQCDQC